MLVTSIFSSTHNVFKRLLIQGRQKSGLCSKELNKSKILSPRKGLTIYQKTKF